MELTQLRLPRGGRQLSLLSYALIAAGLLLFSITALDERLMAWVAEHAAFMIRHPWLSMLPGLLVALPIIWIGGTLFVIGKRALRTQRMPPPGYRPFNIRHVSYGSRAKRLARLYQLAAAFIVLAGLTLPALLTIAFISLAVAFGPV